MEWWNNVISRWWHYYQKQCKCRIRSTMQRVFLNMDAGAHQTHPQMDMIWRKGKVPLLTILTGELVIPIYAEKWPCVFRLCRSTAQCHMCLELDDFEEECDFYQSYNYTFLNNRNSVTNFLKKNISIENFEKTFHFEHGQVWFARMRKDLALGHHVNAMLNSLTVSQTWKLNGILSITLEAVSEPVLEFLKDSNYFNIIQLNH